MFRFLKVLGTGVNGEVCLTENTKTFEKLAIKRLNLKNELEILHKVSPHKNIVQVLNVFDFDTIFYIAMEVMGMTLKKYIQHTQMSENEIKWIFKETLTALDHCHSLSILHRDIKPENILLNRQGNVKICDFSLSTTFSYDMTPYVVTLWYRSPELLIGQRNYNFSIDTWSSCCVLLEMIYKHPPFVAAEDSNISQLRCIFTALGCPEEFNFMNIYENEYIKEMWKNLPFVQETFIFDIHKRPTCKKILESVGECNSVCFRIEEHRATFENAPETWDNIFCEKK